jgi:hypothetical protein
MHPTKFWYIWPSSFRGDWLILKILFLWNCLAKCTETWYESSMESPLLRLLISFRSVNKHGPHRQFFRSFGQAVSEEKIFRNQPIRNKNCLWWPCLLMDRNEMSTLYRGLSIDTSYQVSVHLAKHIWKVLYKDDSFCPDPLTNMAATGDSCFWLVDFIKASSLKPLGQMSRNLVGSIYGKFSIKNPFQRRRLKCEKLTDDGRKVMAKAHIAFGKVS